MKKKELGQFNTSNSYLILSGFENHVKDKVVLDPFAGKGDLLDWAKKNGAKSVSGLDIDNDLCDGNIRYNDSLMSIPYASFNITNPPYLANNKMSSEQKKTYPMKEYEDFYLLAMKRIIDSGADEGIIIVPVNFFSAENSDKVRKEFMNQYDIDVVNYFTQQVFNDTTYNVVSFYYKRKKLSTKTQSVRFVFFPDGIKKIFELEEKYNYRIAGSALSIIFGSKPLNVVRLIEDHMSKNAANDGKEIIALFNDKNTTRKYRISQTFEETISKNIILLNCIDTNASEAGWIKAEDISSTKYKCLVGKNSSRNIAYVLVSDAAGRNISIAHQREIIDLFNERLNDMRREFRSLFLTNFRDNDRKRISFEFCYKLIAYCYGVIAK